MEKENLLDAISDIAREKGINRDRLIGVIQEAITAAAKRKFKQYHDIEARLNPQTGELDVFQYKRVAEMTEDPDNEISLEEARKLDSLAEPGDEVEYEIQHNDLRRAIAQTARQLIFQKIREAERETIYENFKDRKGEILSGVVSRMERNRAIVLFNTTEAILYGRDQIPHERYVPGDHIQVILLDVLNDPKEPSQLVISRTDPLLLTKLFEMEVPEIYDGVVEIVAAAREPGRRAKIAVQSNDPDVDPVGACVGMRGSRVQSIISELRGEKIDIIKWSDDLPTYIANALAPAELTRIKIDDEAGEIDVEVEPDQLSLAIGRQGQNVRLASKLLGYRINISSTQQSTLSLEEQIRERLLASQAQLAGQAATPELAAMDALLTPPGAAEEAAGESAAADAAPAEPNVEAPPEVAATEAGAEGTAEPSAAEGAGAEPAAEVPAAPAAVEPAPQAAAEPVEVAPAPEEPVVEATDDTTATDAAPEVQPGTAAEETEAREVAPEEPAPDTEANAAAPEEPVPETETNAAAPEEPAGPGEDEPESAKVPPE